MIIARFLFMEINELIWLLKSRTELNGLLDIRKIAGQLEKQVPKEKTIPKEISGRNIYTTTLFDQKEGRFCLREGISTWDGKTITVKPLSSDSYYYVAVPHVGYVHLFLGNTNLEITAEENKTMQMANWPGRFESPLRIKGRGLIVIVKD